MIKGIVLDWAGTTVDYGSRAPIIAFAKAFADQGIYLDEQVIRKDIGLSKQEHVKKIFQDQAIQHQWQAKHGEFQEQVAIDQVYTDFKQLISDYLVKTAYVKPGLYKLLKYLHAYGIKIATTSGYYHKMIEIIEQKTALQGYAPQINITSEDTNGVGRPTGVMLQLALKKMGLADPSKVIKVGDTINDILEAKNAGCIAVGVVEGGNLTGLGINEFLALSFQQQNSLNLQAKEQLFAAGADYVIANLDDLVAIIDQINKEAEE
jgi:phosphonoacetaldehyde hydrolase